MTTKKPIRLVHISDTHDKLKYLIEQKKIPDGDILCHTGDFSNRGGKESLEHFNYLLGILPHKYKIIVFGNHDYYQNLQPQEIQKYLTNGIYLQDSSVEIEGLKFYGAPWTNFTMAYGTNNLKYIWDHIPKDTDVLMTHMPPFNVFDLAWDLSQTSDLICQYCNESHKKFRHWGSYDLYQKVVQEIKPKLHLFGHVHDEIGIKKINETYFCNSAMDIEQKAHVFTF
eukprot:gene6691-10856_t